MALSTKLYEQAAQAAQQAEGAEQGSSEKADDADDVVDADYEEVNEDAKDEDKKINCFHEKSKSDFVTLTFLANRRLKHARLLRLA